VTGKLVLENLKHRPMRSLLSILLIGVPVIGLGPEAKGVAFGKGQP